MSRPVTLVDMVNQWLMCGFMAGVMALIYWQLLPRLDRIESTIQSNHRETREHISETTRRAIQVEAPEEIKWENLNGEMNRLLNR